MKISSPEATRRRIGIPTQVFIGLGLGLLVGVFFGEQAAFLGIGGDIFIAALQITVIPYVVVALITSLGRLTIDDAKALALTGRLQLGGTAGIKLPNAALTSTRGAPAVWVLDPQTNTVALRNIDVAGFELDRVTVAQGLDAGELVVTAGVQTLRPGQQVRLPGARALDPEETANQP